MLLGLWKAGDYGLKTRDTTKKRIHWESKARLGSVAANK